MDELKEIFEEFATRNTWNNQESKSGPGSTIIYTCNLRAQIAVFVEKYSIKTLFDAPCGDFNWMKEVNFPKDFKYIGGDISNILVGDNIKQYQDDERKFIEFDVTKDKFPVADIWFCRDCFFHLPYIHIFRALSNFARSETKLMIMTNHINSLNFKNADIEKPGGFRLLDFFIEPFCLPRDVMFTIADYVHPHPQREMCVWTREQVSTSLKDMAFNILNA